MSNDGSEKLRGPLLYAQATAEVLTATVLPARP